MAVNLASSACSRLRPAASWGPDPRRTAGRGWTRRAPTACENRRLVTSGVGDNVVADADKRLRHAVGTALATAVGGVYEAVHAIGSGKDFASDPHLVERIAQQFVQGRAVGGGSRRRKPQFARNRVRGLEVAGHLFVLIGGACRSKRRAQRNALEQDQHSTQAQHSVACGKPTRGVAGDVAERQTLVVANAALVELVEQSARIWILIENITIRHLTSVPEAENLGCDFAHNMPGGSPSKSSPLEHDLRDLDALDRYQFLTASSEW